MLNRSGERGHPCLFPDLSGKALSFCPLSVMLAVGLSYMALIMLRTAPFIPTLLSVLSEMGAVSYRTLFPHRLIWSCDFCLCCCWCDVLCLLICEYCTILASLGWIPLGHGVWSFNVLLDVIYNILLRILASMFISDIGLKFSFFVVSLSGFGIRMMLAS